MYLEIVEEFLLSLYMAAVLTLWDVEGTKWDVISKINKIKL